MKYIVVLFAFVVALEALPTPRYLIEPSYENYQGEYARRNDKSLTYEKYLDEWGKAIFDVMQHHTDFKIKKNLGKTNPSYEVATGIPQELPDSSIEAFKIEKQRKGVESYSYEQFLNEWKEKAHKMAKDYIKSEKERRLKQVTRKNQ